MRKLVFLILFFVFIFLPINRAYAARSITITSPKDSLFGDEEMQLTASMSGFTTGETIYIKGAFYQDGTTKNYFGYTKNNSDWIKNGNSTTTQRQIKIGDWDGKVSVKSDFADSGYKGEGGYKLILGFYYITSGGNFSSVNWSPSILDVNLNEPDPTPTNTPVPQSTSTPTSVPALTKTPTPTKSPTATPTSKITPTSIVSGTVTPDNFATGSSVSNNNILGASTTNDPKSTPSSAKKVSSSSGFFSWKFFVLGGLGIITCACGILLFREWKKQKSLEL